MMLATIRHIRLVAVAAAIAASVTARAQQAQEDRVLNLDEVVVTATRTPKTLKDVPVQTRVITADEIRMADATNIQDLLQQELPGIEFSYAMNQQVHLNFAGFGGQSVLILVDGERLAGETLDDTDFTRLNMANVKRIEIVKGAASAIYGSNAGGGVINIITEDASDGVVPRPWGLSLNARLAKHNEQRYGGYLTLNGNRLSNRLDVDYHGIDNYSVRNGSEPKASVYSTVFGEDNYNFKDKVTWRPMDGVRITGHAGYFYRTVVRTAANPERYRDFAGGIRGKWQMTGRDDINVSYNFDQYDKSDYQTITRLDIRDYSNVQNSFRATYNHAFGQSAILTAGADYMHDYLYNLKLEDNKREQDAADVFAQMDLNLGSKLELVAALRYDYYSDGDESMVTPKLTARYQPQHNLTLRMGYGMGFRAPTLKERYYDFDMAGLWIVKGNAQLKSETSHNLNASAEWLKRNWCLTLSAYYNNVKNKLATGMPFFMPGDMGQLYLQYINLDGYSVYGGEATAQAAWVNGMSLKVSYALTKEDLPKDKDGQTANIQYLPARRHTVTARVGWDRQITRRYGLGVVLNGRFMSSVSSATMVDYYDMTRGTQKVCYPAYALFKLSTEHRIGSAVRITLAVDNLLNYKPRYYYLNSPVTDGANLMLGVSVDVDRLTGSK